jgi:hypothetical protein
MDIGLKSGDQFRAVLYKGPNPEEASAIQAFLLAHMETREILPLKNTELQMRIVTVYNHPRDFRYEYTIEFVGEII